MKKLLGLAIATLVFCGLMATGATSAKNDAYDESAELRDAVYSKGVMKHLRKLHKIATENGGTRASGTPGYDASADYVAKKMEKAGYDVERQEFQFDVFTEDRRASSRSHARSRRITSTARTSSRRSSPARATSPPSSWPSTW